MGAIRRTPIGRTAPASPCSSSSTTRRAARTTSCTATRPRKPSCPRSSAPQPWPGQRHMNMESIYEYGSRAGFWRLWRLFTERGVPVTVYGVATAMARNPEAVAAMQEAGWEIASHGLKWIDYKDASAERGAKRYRGGDPHPHRGHRPAPARLVSRALLDPHHRARHGGRRLPLSRRQLCGRTALLARGPHGPQLVVPYTLDANDMRFATPQGFNSGDQFFAYLKDSLDYLHAEGTERPKMMSVGLHCRLVGRPGRAAALARFIDYALAKGDVWMPRRIDIARHWIARARGPYAHERGLQRPFRLPLHPRRQRPLEGGSDRLDALAPRRGCGCGIRDGAT